MSKRFTETDKWRDPWFRKLSPTSKLFFLWLVDNCDKAGVIDLDLEAAAFDIGQPVNSDHLAELQSRWEKLSNGKIRLTKFGAFQYGTLSEKCTPHIRVIETIRSHGLSFPLCDAKSTTLPTTLPTRVGTTLEEKRGKEGNGQEGKRGEPEKRGVQGGGVGLDPKFVSELLVLYRRPSSERLTYDEESTVAEIIRERASYWSELDEILKFQESEPRYFPQSLSRLLSGWQDILDRSRAKRHEAKASDRPHAMPMGNL